MKMHRNRSQRQNTQPNLCSIIRRRLFLRNPKGYAEGKQELTPPSGSSQPPGSKTDGDVNKKNEKKKAANGNNIKSILKKLKKTTPFLPKALESPYAYEKGKKGCEKCNMNIETYKAFLKSVRVIELIVDDIISMEQKEMLEREDEGIDEKQDTNKVNSKEEKNIRIQFEIYCHKDIDHNLKCVLLKLQKTIGDILLQVCYCKAKIKPNDEKCKRYDVTLTVLEQLKFEYTNLTDKIIRLFKKTPSKEKAIPEVCVACMKDEITEYTDLLENMLKSGRNIKITMRNEDATKEQCCARNYPHVHAIVQNRHVVLKFELPFEVTHPEQRQIHKKPVAYDEWPKSFSSKQSEKVDQEPSKENPSYPEIPRRASLISNKSANTEKLSSASCNSPVLDKKLSSRCSELSHKEPVPHSSIPTEHEKYPQSSLPTEQEKYPQSSIPTEQEKYPQSSIPTEQVQYPRSSKLSRSVSSNTSTLSKIEDRIDSLDSDSSRYCGCNFDLVYEKLNIPQNKNKDDGLQKKESERELSSDDESDDYSLNETESVSTIKQHKRVSFNPAGRNTILYMADTTVTPQSVFKKTFDKPDQSPKSSETKSSRIGKGRESSISAIKSVSMKNKPLSEKPKSVKDLIQGHNAPTSFFSTPQYEIKQTLVTEPTIADLQHKSSRSLNKKQVSEVLKELGTTKLLSVAECCKHNKSLNDFKNISDLPFSASLHSLPLDEEDLNHITRAVEKLISDEVTVLDPDCDEEWEIQYAEDLADNKEDKIEGHKAVTARDAASNICVEIQTDKPVTRNNISKSLYQKDDENLPTILEEKVSLEEKPSKWSQEEKKNVLNKSKSSIKSRTTELRYLTVEYPNISNQGEISDKDRNYRQEKSTSNVCYHEHLERYFNINLNNDNNAKKVSKGNVSDDSFNFCCSITELQSTNSNKLDKLSNKCNKKQNLSPEDEMIMFDVIHLTSNDSKVTTAVGSSNEIFRPLNDVPKPLKPTSSCNFFNQENIKFEINKVCITSSCSTMQVGDFEAEDQQIEPTFQETIDTSIQNMSNFPSVNSTHPVINNNMKSILEKRMFWDASGSTENKEADKMKYFVINSESQENIDCYDSRELLDEETISKNELNGNAECERIKNSHLSQMSSIVNIYKNDGIKMCNDKQNMIVNNELLTNVTDYEELESINGGNLNKQNLNLEFYEDEENCKSEGGIEIFLNSRLKANNNFSLEQKILSGNDKNKGTLFEPSTVDNDKTPRENKEISNLAHRNYLISKKPMIGTQANFNIQNRKTCKKRKPFLLKNSNIRYKLVKCKISKPELKYPKMLRIVLHQEISRLIIVSSHNHEPINAENNFGIVKSYISMKNTHKLESGQSLNSLVSVFKNHTTEEENDESLTNISEFIQGSKFIADALTNNEEGESCSPNVSNAFYLFDINGQPLTDTSGRPLHNLNGQMLLKLGEDGVPLCDSDNRPIYDSSGHAVDEKDFNPVEPPFSGILKVITPSGDPMVLFDFEGRPLTSFSGTMLVDSQGKGLLRFSCKGNPITDYRGKPIFNSEGKQALCEM